MTYTRRRRKVVNKPYKPKKISPPSIPKGKMVVVDVKTDSMSDKRFFTRKGKMNVFLRYVVKNHTGVKIKFKEIRLN